MVTKKTFCKAMTTLQKEAMFENEVNDLSRKYNRDEWTSGYSLNNENIIIDMIKILEEVLYDKNGLIEYWWCELDCGNLWKPGAFIEKEKDIKLKTPEDLWNYLVGV